MIDINSYIQNGLDGIKGSIGDFLIECLKGVGIFIIEKCDVVCPIVCLLALAFYIGGSKKAGHVVSASFIFYFLACALRRFVK